MGEQSVIQALGERAEQEPIVEKATNEILKVAEKCFTDLVVQRPDSKTNAVFISLKKFYAETIAVRILDLLRE